MVRPWSGLPAGGASSRLTRRAFAAGAVLAPVGAGTTRGAAAVQPTRLETCLFNLRDDVLAGSAEDMVAGLRGYGAQVGRNLNSTPFPARFEWVCMMGRPASTRTDGPSVEAGMGLIPMISPLCRSLAACELRQPLPAGFVPAPPGVQVRHTVMFDFKPGTPAEARERNVQAIREMGRLPMVLSFWVAPNIAFGSDPAQMEWQVIGDFGSLKDYQAYAAAPAHLSIRDDFQAHTSRVAFIDVAL